MSAEWVAQATTPDKDFLQSGQISYQWWVPRDSQGDFAWGLGQMIYVNPEANVVIVKTSADENFKAHEYEAIEVFRAIAEGKDE